MKKVFMIAMSAVLALGIASCGNKAAEQAQREADSIEAARIQDSIAAAELAAELEALRIQDSIALADSLEAVRIADSIAAAQAAAKAKNTKTTKPATVEQPKAERPKLNVNDEKIKATLKAKEAETTVQTVDASTQAAKDAVEETNKTIKRRVK